MYKLRVSMLTLAVLGLAASAALAQRGVGDPAGVARSGVKSEIVTLSGEVLEVKTERPNRARTPRAVLLWAPIF